MAVAADSHRDFLIPKRAVLRPARQRIGFPIQMLCVYSFVIRIISQIYEHFNLLRVFLPHFSLRIDLSQRIKKGMKFAKISRPIHGETQAVTGIFYGNQSLGRDTCIIIGHAHLIRHKRIGIAVKKNHRQAAVPHGLNG